MSPSEFSRLLKMTNTEFEMHLNANYSTVSGRVGKSPTFFKKIGEAWDGLSFKTKDALTEKVCNEMNYCELTSDTELQAFAIAISSLIIVDFGAISLPIFLIALILIKYGYFDRLCRCNRRGI